MGFNPVDIPAFGGLVTNTDVEDSSGAIDLSNVLVAKSGTRLEPRPGYTLNGTLDLSTYSGIAAIGSNQVLAGYSTGLQLITASTGASVTTGSYSAGTPWVIVPFGNPSTASIPTIDNPSFETNTTGWTPTTSTITRDTGVKDTGTASGRWDNTGASDVLGASDALEMVISGTWLAGTSYTILTRMKASATGGVLSVTFGDSDDQATNSWTFSTTGWVWRGVTWTPAVNLTAASLFLSVTSGSAYYNIDSLEMAGAGKAYGANGAATAKLTTDSTLVTPLCSTKTAAETAFNAGRTAPVPYAFAAQPKDNRLVAAGFASSSLGPNTTASSGSHVFFSQPDDPDKWDETDYVVLSPGDGETIRAACSWNDYLFVFKRTKFFVFYGNSTDATGGSVFNYRTVRDAWPENSSDIYQGEVAVAPDGVYVLARSGVWRTTGGAPELVSGALSNLFTDGSLSPRGVGTGGAFYHRGRLYFSVTYNSAAAWLVRHEGQWLIWTLTDTPNIGTASGASIYFPAGVSTSGRKGLLKMDGTATTDNGTAISGSYTAAYRPLGGAGAETHVRSSELHGTGTVTLAWGADEQTHDTADTVAMSGGIGYDRTGARGRTLSWKLAFTAAGWTLDRLIPMIQTVRTRS